MGSSGFVAERKKNTQYIHVCTPSIPAGRPNNGDAAVLLLYMW